MAKARNLFAETMRTRASRFPRLIAFASLPIALRRATSRANYASDFSPIPATCSAFCFAPFKS